MNIPGLSSLAGIATSRARIYGWLAIVLLLGAAIAAHFAEVYSLKADAASAYAAQANAEKVLSNFIAAEAKTVSAAVQRARSEERESYTHLMKAYDELKRAKAADADSLADARQRLYNLAQGAAAHRCGQLPTVSAPAGGAEGANAGLPQADRQLIDRLLQLGDRANEAVRQRDFAVKQYESTCAKEQ